MTDPKTIALPVTVVGGKRWPSAPTDRHGMRQGRRFESGAEVDEISLLHCQRNKS